jgi:protein TonB
VGEQRQFRHFDVNEPDPDETRMHKWLPVGGAAAVAVVLAVAGYFLVQRMGGTSAPQKPAIQQVSLVVPPPPPPPPEQQIEEPEVEELEIEEPEPIADDPSNDAPPEDLGLDAEGVAGSDAFGLKARKGGRGLLGGGDPFAWYAGVLQRDLQKALSNDDALRGQGDYAVIISIYLTKDGFIERTELESGSNRPELDSALKRVLTAGIRVSREPPEDLPQPVRLRISSRG